MHGKTVGAGQPVTRKEVQSARVWLTRARESQLTDIAQCALVTAARALRAEYGFPEEVVAEPSEDQLVTMLTVLDREFAHCVVLGLSNPVFKNLPAAVLVTRRPQVYFRAADSEPPSDARDIGPALSVPAPPAESDQRAEAATMTSPEQQDSRIPDDGQLRALRESAAQLRSLGTELAQALRETAQLMSEGRHLSTQAWTADAVADWLRQRTLLAGSVAEAGGTWGSDSGHEELAAEFDRLQVEASQARERRLDELRQGEAQLQAMVAVSKAAVAAHLEQALEQLAVQIADLESGRGEGNASVAESADGEAEPRPVTRPDTSADAVLVAAPSRISAPDGYGVPATESSEAPSDEAAAEEPDALGPDQVTAAGETDAGGVDAGETHSGVTYADVTVAEETYTGLLDASLTVAVEPTAMPEAVPQVPAAAAPAVPSSPDTAAEDTSSQPPAAPEDAPSTAADAASPGPQTADVPWPVGMDHADWDPAAPWETSQDSPVARLIGAGQLPHAYWMTAASQEPEPRAQALAFAAAAFGCVGSDEATQVQIDYDITPERVAEDREAAIVATVAALRAGLTAGWPHVLVSDFATPSGLSEPWQQLLTVLVTAVRDCRTFVPGAIGDLAGPGDTVTLSDLGEEARVLLEDLPRRKIKYQRASRVLQYLTGPSGAPHKALKAVVDWSQGGDAAPLAVLSENMRRPEYVDRLIEEADSRFRTPKQSKEAIHSGALRQLHAAVRSVSELLTKADAVATAMRSRGAAHGSDLPQLATAINQLESYGPPPGVGGATLGLLREWLVGQYVADTLASAERIPPHQAPSADCLLLAPDLPRDIEGRPDLADPRTPRAMAALLAPASPDAALSTYLETGDLHLAKGLIAWVERNLSLLASLPEDWADEATRRCREAEKGWRDRTAEYHRRAAGHLAQIRTLNLMAPDVERDLTGRLQEFADGDEAGRYRYAREQLARLVQELAGLVKDSTGRLRQDLERLRLDRERVLTENDHDRIRALIDEGDTVTAQEFLALANGGHSLPDRPEHDATELVEFVSGLTGPGMPRPGGEGVHASWWVHNYESGERLTAAAAQALESWQALCTKKGRSSEWQQHIPRVLRLLGLEPGGQLHSDRPGQGVRRLKVRATVAEDAGYVAALGSRATSYTILLVWEEQRAGGPLTHLEDADVDANIVLYLHPLGLAGRQALVEAASGRAQQALVIDPAVFGWMVARAPRSFRSLQRITLPWTSFNPYTPFVAGLVPPEVFYGRDDELREVMDPNGGLFLYGGRQLGKSALLQRVAELFPSRSEANVAVYLDLLKAEIGQAEPPEQIWSLLAEGLKRRGVFDAKMSERGGPDVVAKRIRDWLDADESRRLLILADEADAFLTADSRRVFRSGGESTFQNVKRFQQLMEQTNRRLKVVFAGLHQVQRFGDLSNVSTAHGGPDVLVGPLKPHAAVRLVTEPMAALGFVFDRPELVWRILAITNYQANLVQIFCSELIRTLQGRAHPEPERPMRITEEDVQGVAASETVRRRLAERLRFTINLEDRYRVLTLVIALRSLADKYRGDYTAEQLLDLAREAWPQGFDGLGVKRVEIYLTEMVGLGLLVQLGDRSRFAVRSPNVVNMLGTREELELELKETEFSLPYDYDPRAARRLLGRDPKDRIQRYSPLTEGQLHEAAQPGVTLIGVTESYRPPLMIRAAEAFAEARGVEVRKVKAPDDLRVALRDAARLRRNYVLVADLSSLSKEELATAVHLCAEHAGPAADVRVRSAVRKHTGNRSVFLLGDALATGALADEAPRGDTTAGAVPAPRAVDRGQPPRLARMSVRVEDRAQQSDPGDRRMGSLGGAGHHRGLGQRRDPGQLTGRRAPRHRQAGEPRRALETDRTRHARRAAPRHVDVVRRRGARGAPGRRGGGDRAAPGGGQALAGPTRSARGAGLPVRRTRCGRRHLPRGARSYGRRVRRGAQRPSAGRTAWCAAPDQQDRGRSGGRRTLPLAVPGRPGRGRLRRGAAPCGALRRTRPPRRTGMLRVGDVLGPAPGSPS
ncbi:hypothetical protein QBB31_09655 [Streptomyces scabiei]|uniref:hypothetical protein n=1 Tax=Streptomyces scabiei TaxID=1930 RepID=UPI002FF0872A